MDEVMKEFVKSYLKLIENELKLLFSDLDNYHEREGIEEQFDE